MYKMITLYFTPKDPEQFKKHYREVHVDLGVHPLLKRRFHTFDVGSVDEKIMPIPSNVFCYWEGEFESKETFLKCCSEMQAAADDTYKIATGGFLVMHFEVPDAR
jgi:uncharacterized protein (TIGR02118 family)